MEIKRYFYNDLYERVHAKDLSFMQVLMGPRQIGKSTTIAQLAEAWPHAKIIESADTIAPPKAEWIEFLWQKAMEKPAPCLLVIDEIQKITHWANAIKRLFDQDRKKNKLRVVLSGSASLALQSGLNDSLAGRYEIIRCPHWGLDESIELFSWDLTTFLKFGGYPAAASLVKDPTRWRAFIRDAIIEPVIGKDLQTVVTIQKPALLRQLFELAMRHPAQEISYQKLLGQLQENGNTSTIKHYLDVLAGGFLIAILEKYSGSIVRQKSSSPKILPLAPALIHAFSDPAAIDQDSEWLGRVFEAAIGAHLYRLPGELMYWRDGDDEVDFVLRIDNRIIGIEVKSGRRKRQSGLIAFKKKYPHAETMIFDKESGLKFLARLPQV